jgi:hypothetical protein
MVPIQVKAQMMRQWPPAGHSSTVGPFAIMPDGSPDRSNAGRRKGAWRQSDVKRAIAAAEQAGLESYRVEIAADGTISIIVGAPSETANPDSFGDLLGS